MQSEPIAEQESMPVQKEVQEIMVFEDTPGESVDYASLMDSTIDEDQDGVGHLANFLSRPVLIDTFSWTQATMTNPANAFAPWTAFFLDSKIRAKIQNFSRLHSKLHVKFVLNASPFFYGAIRAAYFPCLSLIPASTNPNDLIPVSQAPGVWLTPQDMSTAEMTLPFLCPANWLDPNRPVDLTNMGMMTFYVYSQLQSANGASGASITISTYAWAEDAELAGPTTVQTIQASPVREGKVSGLADKVATVAGGLSKIPVIGSYASAVQMGASAVGKVAAMFGFSNAPVLGDVSPYQPKSFHAFANCETSMPIDKLCVDPKNEVVVDNRVTGTDSTDPLSLANFCRESYFGQITWTTAQAPETNLTTIGILPGSNYATAGTFQVVHHHTPLSYAARMFSKWRGSIIVRAKVINTKYHKGRLRLSWDPSADITSVADSETTCFTKIIDLEEDNDIEFEVPYKAQTVWLNTSFANRPMWNNSESTANALNTNGYLAVKVQNILSAPTGSGTVQILLFMRPGSDFQFAQPNELPPKFSPLVTQAEAVIDQQPGKTGQHLTDITVGETIASLRPLLHRVSFSNRQFLGRPKTADATFHAVGAVNTTNLISRTPPWFGFASGTYTSFAKHNLDANNGKFNWTMTHPINWLTAPFVGYRGSIVLHADLKGSGIMSRFESASLTRFPSSTIFDQHANPNGRTTVWGVLPSTFSRDATVISNNVSYVPSGQRGMTITKEITQSALSCVSPQYASARFALKNANFADTELTNIVGYPSWQDNFRLDTSFACNNAPSATSAYPYVDLYYSGGVDYQPVFFVCTPVLYEIDYPAPADGYTPIP